MAVILQTKPTILVYATDEANGTLLEQVEYGIEEEGTPFEVIRTAATEAKVIAYKAAQESALSVGIGCTDTEMVLHFKNLPEHKFIYRLQLKNASFETLRILGVNAARLAKGYPFKEDPALEVSF